MQVRLVRTIIRPRRENIRNNLVSASRSRLSHQTTGSTHKKIVGIFSKRKSRRYNKHLMRLGVLSINLIFLGLVGLFILHGSSVTSESPQWSQSSASLAMGKEQSDPIDKLSSADVAVNVARLVRLDESTAVTNNADTISTQQIVAASTDRSVVKPQIVTTALKSNKDIKKYVTVNGDTVSSVAAKFGITSDTIRLSNNISGEALPVGKELLISPVNGVVYSVKAGDTADSVAARYRASKEQVIAFNDAEMTGLVPGAQIVIPDGLSPASAVVRTSSAYVGGFAFGSSAMYGGNGYDYGWCTWHAANRRIQIGRPIPTNFGNAISWLGGARAAGLAVGSAPQDGAVLYQTNIGGLGHVAFVEHVNADGTVLVSDMNYQIWGKVTYRTISPGEASSYRYIY